MAEDPAASLADRLKALLQYPLPQHALSRLTYWLTRIEMPGFKDWLIASFIRRFGVDMSEAVEADPRRYPSFNAFFTRALRASARPLALGRDSILCPVDGAVSQIGAIRDERIFQAKDREFTALELLGGDTDTAALFADGMFATLYLSPRDYHRVHMPVAGSLRMMLHVPGRLFSVNPSSTRAVPRLFARNERVVCLFETSSGPMALVMVGALNVASIETVWAGEITPPHRSGVRRWEYRGSEVELEQGAELGRFNMGSTVILLFAPEWVQWEERYLPGAAVKMGERLATRL